MLTPSQIACIQCFNKLLHDYNDTASIVAFDLGRTQDNEIVKIANKDSGIVLDLTNPVPKYKHFIATLIVFSVTNITYLEKFINSTYNSLPFNPEAKYIVIYRNVLDIDKIFDIFWFAHITRAIVIDGNNDVYKGHQYYGKFCGRKIEAEFLFNCDSMNIKAIDAVLTGAIWNMHGCEVRVIAMPYVPYVINVYKPKRPGIEIKVLNTARDLYNFKVFYATNNLPRGGVKDKNGSYSNTYGVLQSRKVEVIFGGIRTEGSLLYDFDASLPYCESYEAFYVPAAAQLPNYVNLTQIFSSLIWSLVLTSIVTFIIIYTIFGYLTNNQHYTNIIVNTFTIFSIIAGQVSPKVPTPAVQRILFITWLIYAFLIMSFYISMFKSYLINPIYEPQIKTVEEALAAGLTLGGDENRRNIYQEFVTKRAQTIYTNWKLIDTMEGINRTAFKRNMATMGNTLYVNYLMKDIYMDAHSKELIYDLPRELKFYVWFVMLKGFPLKRMLERVITRLDTAGLIQKWKEEVTYRKSVEIPEQYFPISIDFLFINIGLYQLGIGLAVLVYVFECIAWKYKKHIAARIENRPRFMYLK